MFGVAPGEKKKANQDTPPMRAGANSRERFDQRSMFRLLAEGDDKTSSDEEENEPQSAAVAAAARFAHR